MTRDRELERQAINQYKEQLQKDEDSKTLSLDEEQEYLQTDIASGNAKVRDSVLSMYSTIANAQDCSRRL
ncbi:hypothetical protein ABRD05_12790 [Bacillus velezensis]|nr:hypothetical protein [Bacillus velezensis]